jgi:hypothetical protein
MTKEELLNYAIDLRSDDKQKREDASKAILAHCEPLFKKWYEEINKYGDYNISDFEGYLPNMGYIESVDYCPKCREFCFLYICDENKVRDNIIVDFDVLSDEKFIEKQAREYWEHAVSCLEEDIVRKKKAIAYMEKALEELKKKEPKKL